METASQSSCIESSHSVCFEGTSQSFMEHRWGTRARLRKRVGLYVGESSRRQPAILREISSSGALISADLTLPVLGLVIVELSKRSPGRVELLQWPGCIVRRAPNGWGIEWLETLQGPLEPFLGDTPPARVVTAHRPAPQRMRESAVLPASGRCASASPAQTAMNCG